MDREHSSEYVVVKPGHYAARFRTEEEAISHRADMERMSTLSGFSVYRSDQLPEQDQAIINAPKELEGVV